MRKTKKIFIGNKEIGGNSPILIQSMTNTKTSDIDATVSQILALERAGCELVRCAITSKEDALALKEIKKQIHIPLAADIQFDYKLALLAIENGADKIRINPGNIGTKEEIGEIVEKCKKHNIPIRIGINSGSIEKDLAEKFGNSKEALVESAIRSIRILESFHFHNIILSVKSTNLEATIEAYKVLNANYSYPLHIGITESGPKQMGTIKSSIGLGILLYEGIGDTIRVSLTADPVEEIGVAKDILASLGLYNKPVLISCPTCGRTEYNMMEITKEIESFLNTLGNVKLTVAIMGCAVNGPAEAKDADIGIAGGKGEALLFKKGQAIRKIKEENIIKEFKEEINQMIKGEY